MADKILIVDDEKSSRELLIYLLTEDGFEVDSSVNGRDALDKIKSGISYGCVVSDVKMPEMDGIEFIKQCTPIAPTLPIIFVSGIASVKMAVEVLELGAASLLEKPYENKKLLNTIRETLSLRSKIDRKHLSHPFLEKKWTYEFPSSKEYIPSIIESLIKALKELEFISPLKEKKVEDAIKEAIENAISHGNRNSLNKYIFLNASITNKQLVITIQDEGEGFNFLEYIDTEEISSEAWPKSPGLLRIYQETQKVEFNSKGNQITLTFRKS